MPWVLLTIPPARKALRKLPRQVRQHILKAADKLRDDPHNAKQLDPPWQFLRSLRVVYRRTHYRLVYEVRRQQIIIHYVSTRQNFYRKLRQLNLKPVR